MTKTTITSPSTTGSFIPEHVVYALLKKVGIATPRHYFIKRIEELENLKFSEGEAVVVKGMAEQLWHKSDHDALHFCEFEIARLTKLIAKMRENLSTKFKWIGALVTERIKINKADHAPSEILVSLKIDQNSGTTISMGFGGLLTEEWGRQLKNSLLVWPVSVYSPEQAVEELEQHWLGKILLGKVRQQSALTTREQLADFLKKLWLLIEQMQQQQIEFIEINPFVINQQNKIVALDGVGLKKQHNLAPIQPVPVKDLSFLSPRRIAVAGVSNKPGNIGKLIIDNLKQSSLKQSDLIVIKPGLKIFADLTCIDSVKALSDSPVDILILALPASACVEMIEQVCKQGYGAEVIYIVAGGIGDGADRMGFGQRLSRLIENTRTKKQWCPAIVGPNGLGMLLSPLKLNSLFIPQQKLNVKFDSHSQVALISQSGAFLITRLSRHSNLSLKYGFSIGNQLDMKLSDFMALIARDKSVRVLGLYIEGFADGDVSTVAEWVKLFRMENRHVVIYKGGRSQLGQTAAAGHTGAMTGDYQIQKRLLSKAGAIIAESFNQFNAVFKWTAAYPDLHTLGKLAIVTNAGYETVGSVDTLGDNDSGRLYEFNQDDTEQLNKVIRRHHLEGLVAPSNPLDLTPMANEAMYYDCVKSMIEFGAGIVMLGLVPLSEKLDTEQLNETEEFAKRLRKLAQFSGRLIGIVIDAGVPYQEYKAVFERHGFPVFDGMDTAVLGTNVLKRTF